MNLPDCGVQGMLTTRPVSARSSCDQMFNSPKKDAVGKRFEKAAIVGVHRQKMATVWVTLESLVYPVNKCYFFFLWKQKISVGKVHFTASTTLQECTCPILWKDNKWHSENTAEILSGLSVWRNGESLHFFTQHVRREEGKYASSDRIHVVWC